MTATPISQLQSRVQQAAERVLQKNGTVGIIELLVEMRFIHWGHVDEWRRGNTAYRYLSEHIQCGPEKFQQTQRHFHDWAKALGLATVQAEYARRSVGGTTQLQYSANGDPTQEALVREHYARADLTEKQQAKLEQKLAKVDDLVVFIAVSESTVCSECSYDMSRGTFFTLEQQQPLCLSCADMDHLVMLPAGDVAMTRRAKKYSPLSAVVTKFNRSRKRYERQGLLVSEAALDRAEEECITDADERAARRKVAAAMRVRGGCQIRPTDDQGHPSALPQVPRHRGPRDSHPRGRTRQRKSRPLRRRPAARRTSPNPGRNRPHPPHPHQLRHPPSCKAPTANKPAK